MTILLSLTLVLTLVNSVCLGVFVFLEFQKMRIRNVVKPSTELADFFTDVKRHGYGFVRVDPDSVMARSPR